MSARRMRHMTDQRVIGNNRSRPSAARSNPSCSVWNIQVVHTRMALDMPPMRNTHEAQQIQPDENRRE